MSAGMVGTLDDVTLGFDGWDMIASIYVVRPQSALRHRSESAFVQRKFANVCALSNR